MMRAIAPVLTAFAVVGCNTESPTADSSVADGPAATGSEVVSADRDWLTAVEQRDADKVAARLAAEFQWIDTRGRSRDGAEAIANIAGLAEALDEESGVQSYYYGHVEVFTSERPGERLMRVWTLQPAGWRLFAVIGTALETGTTPFAATGSAVGRDCDNPCRSMPYVPDGENEQAIADLFMQLKMDEWHPNPERWAPYVLDGVYYTTATARLSKQARIEHLTALQASGEPSLPGDPVAAMRIFDFGDSAVMLARHDPYRGGQPYLSVRVWAFREGRWQLANTQQTAIADAPASPPL